MYLPLFLCLYEWFWKGSESDQRPLTLLWMRLLVWRVVDKMLKFRLTFLIIIVMLAINSRSWEMISGFNLMATRREKWQGMKLCSGPRTICDSTLPDQSHAWKYARKLDPTASSRQPAAGSLCLRFLWHATWMNILFMVISMLFSGESNYMFSSVAFQIQSNSIIIKIKATFYKEIV